MYDTATNPAVFIPVGFVALYLFSSWYFGLSRYITKETHRYAREDALKEAAQREIEAGGYRAPRES